MDGHPAESPAEGLTDVKGALNMPTIAVFVAR